MSTVFRIEKNTNYTVMSNHHLKNRSLSLKAKGLFSVILSLPEEWDYTLGGLAAISKESLDAIRTAVNELERFGYLHREQLRDERGRLAHNEYLVYECPENNPYHSSDNTENNDTAKSSTKATTRSVKPISPSLENPATVEKQSDLPSLENPITDNPTTEKPSTENPTQLNKNISNKNLLNNNIINQSNLSRAREDKPNDGIDVIGSQRQRDFYFAKLKENIGYDYFCEYYAKNRDDFGDFSGRQRFEELLSIMLDVICSGKPTIRVNGEELPQQTVKEVYLKLNGCHIEYVLKSLGTVSNEIHNIRAYLITTLYNAPSTMGNYQLAEDNYGDYSGAV